jgi:hypothetical protein
MVMPSPHKQSKHGQSLKEGWRQFRHEKIILKNSTVALVFIQKGVPSSPPISTGGDERIS